MERNRDFATYSISTKAPFKREKVSEYGQEMTQTYTAFCGCAHKKDASVIWLKAA